MPYSRNSVVEPEVSVALHCISRCVRRAWLCGRDPLTAKDYEHRRSWIYKGIQALSKIFAVEVFACSVMNNHCSATIKNTGWRQLKFPDWGMGSRNLLMNYSASG